MFKYFITISGITCTDCIKHVHQKLYKIPGITDISISDWQNGETIIKASNPIKEGLILNTITQAGYQGELTKKNQIKNYTVKNSYNYDIAIIGGGSAGFAAAIKSAEFGFKAAIIEKGTIGGTCVNIGCIPSKFIIHHVSKGLSWESISKKRDSLVASLRKQKYEDILTQYPDNITYIKGDAHFINDNTLLIKNEKKVTASKFIIASGSNLFIPEIPGINEISPLTSTDLLFIKKIPEELIIVGGRFIALELGQAFSRLGSKVTIIQRSDRLIPQYDQEISVRIRERFIQENIRVLTCSSLIKAFKDGYKKAIEISIKNQTQIITGDVILFATGRKGNTDDLNLETIGVKTDSNGFIKTDNFLQTNNPQIFAAGDILATPGLVYVAAKEGQIAAGNALSPESVSLGYKAVPEVIFTNPQIAKVGLTTFGSDKENIKIESVVFKIADTPYGFASEDTGVIKLIKLAQTDEILGGEIIAKDAGNMIQILTVAIKAKMTSKQLIDTYFPYLTAIEGMKLGLLSFDKDLHKLSCCAG